MSKPTGFAEFIARIRAGDDRAAEELVRQYEPLIRREVRMHLQDERLCRLFDSLDISQAVLLSFFVRTAAGQFELDRPDQLLHVLIAMARNKLASAARREHRQRRDQRRMASGAEKLDFIADPSPSPADSLARAELLAYIRQSLTAEEMLVADLRGEGHSWETVAARLGSTPDGRRMQLARAIGRIAKEIGVDLDDA